MARGGGLTDGAWARIGPPLPGYGRRGGRWRGQRPVVGGAYRASREPGCPGGTCRRCIPWQACHDRFVRWRRRDGTWDRLPAHARTRTRGPRGARSGRPSGRRAWTPRWAARTGRQRRKKGTLTPLNEALGRGRGGSSTKPHLSCDGRGLPLSLALTAGQRNESTQLVALLEDLPGEGRGIAHTLPERDDQPERREQRGDKPPAFEAGLYRKRDAVEGRGQQAQAVAVATRYEKRAANYRAVVVAASPVLWMAS
jgi:hypothetical protein